MNENQFWGNTATLDCITSDINSKVLNLDDDMWSFINIFIILFVKYVHQTVIFFSVINGKNKIAKFC
jgi:hypothetical protein